jgi:glycine oxidase
VTGARNVAIVGSGIIGCAIARELAIRGASCTVFDDRPIAGGATQASAGMLAPWVEAHDRTPLLDLCVRSLDLYDSWITAIRAESGFDIEYRRIGTLEVALDRAHADALRSAADDPCGSPRVWFEPERAVRDYPVLGAVAGALHTPAHGYVAAASLASALAAAAMRHGASFERATVTRIDRADRTVSVTTRSGTSQADGVVIAAGAWTNAIAGVRTPPVHPVRGQLLQLGWRGQPLSTIVWGPECYIVPRLDGSVLIGATVEDAGFDERTTAAGVRDLLEAACELLPEAWHASFLGARVGLRPATPDELPALGPAPEMPEVVHALGHYRNGVLLAPITARIVADWIVDGRRDPAFDAFDPGRFF